MDKKKKEILLSIVIGIGFNGLSCALIFLLNYYLTFYELVITSSNKSEVLSVMATLFQIVFITTSLLSVLSNKEDTVYWENIVDYVLINPKFFNFYSISIYCYVSTFITVVGYCLKNTTIVIAGAFITLLFIAILFFKMTQIYFRRDVIKKDLKRIFQSDIELFDKIQNESDKQILEEKIEKRLNEMEMKIGLAIESHQWTIIEENLLLLFSINRKRTFFNNIALRILQIFEVLLEKDESLLKKALLVYSEQENIGICDDFIYETIFTLSGKKERGNLKDYLCEIFIKISINILKKNENSLETTELDSDNSSTISNWEKLSLMYDLDDKEQIDCNYEKYKTYERIVDILLEYKNFSKNGKQYLENKLTRKQVHNLFVKTMRCDTERSYFVSEHIMRCFLERLFGGDIDIETQKLFLEEFIVREDWFNDSKTITKMIKDNLLGDNSFCGLFKKIQEQDFALYHEIIHAILNKICQPFKAPTIDDINKKIVFEIDQSWLECWKIVTDEETKDEDECLKLINLINYKIYKYSSEKYANYSIEIIDYINLRNSISSFIKIDKTTLEELDKSVGWSVFKTI